MKKTLVVVVALAIGLFATVSSAQTPNVSVYFDNTLTQQAADCPAVTPGTVAQTVYVVAANFNMWMQAIEYQIVYPAALTFLGDAVDPATQLSIGSSPLGIGITWPLPANAFVPLVVQTANVLWMCDNCDGFQNQQLVVIPHPSSGLVRAIRWPDTQVVLGVGLTSLVCATIPVEETTWGGIKALYK
jgi:hypothetical protein